MTCEHARPLLSAYFDRELDLTKTLEIETHVRECDRCGAALKEHEALRAALGAGALIFTPPQELESRVRKAVRREARPRNFSLPPYWRWAAVPLAAMLAAVFAWSVALPPGTSSDDALLADLVSGHVRSLMVDHLVDVATADQHTVRPWFNGKVDFAPLVVDLTASGFPLIGGRVDYITGRPVAVLVYKRRQHIVNVFIWPSAGAGDQNPHVVASHGYHLLRWTQSGLTFWAVSDVSAADLESLAHRIQEAA